MARVTASQLLDYCDAMTMEFFRGDLADAPDTAHRQRVKNALFVGICYYTKTVGLFKVRSEFGKKFIRGYTHRSDKIDLVSDRILN